ncbi:hypothetical protein [Burkholderia anthina]|uniref:hypothetical protein n=1 Tax=Burkholderia anthina TaxID=179879 RepID=UPI00158B61C3|nr:hypothetical protein [Burkholderia anthina]
MRTHPFVLTINRPADRRARAHLARHHEHRRIDALRAATAARRNVTQLDAAIRIPA